MGKKGKTFISLAEVDHKLQFVNIIGVITDITPTIKRNKLTVVDLELSDNTLSRPGFNVKLNLESEILNKFLDVSKKGYIAKLNDVRVIKNEGEVYASVKDEEDLEMFSDNLTSVKWHEEEKNFHLSDAIKVKIRSLVQWKISNFKDITVLPETLNEDKKITRRSGLNTDDKSLSVSKSTKNKQSSDNLSSFNEVKVNNQKNKEAVLHLEEKEDSITSAKVGSRNSLQKESSPVPEKTKSSGVSPSSSPSSILITNKGATTSSITKSSSLLSLNKSGLPKKSRGRPPKSKLDEINTSGSNKSLNTSGLTDSAKKSSLNESFTFLTKKKLRSSEGSKQDISTTDESITPLTKKRILRSFEESKQDISTADESVPLTKKRLLRSSEESKQDITTTDESITPMTKKKLKISEESKQDISTDSESCLSLRSRTSHESHTELNVTSNSQNRKNDCFETKTNNRSRDVIKSDSDSSETFNNKNKILSRKENNSPLSKRKYLSGNKENNQTQEVRNHSPRRHVSPGDDETTSNNSFRTRRRNNLEFKVDINRKSLRGKDSSDFSEISVIEKSPSSSGSKEKLNETDSSFIEEDIEIHVSSKFQRTDSSSLKPNSNKMAKEEKVKEAIKLDSSNKNKLSTKKTLKRSYFSGTEPKTSEAEKSKSDLMGEDSNSNNGENQTKNKESPKQIRKKRDILDYNVVIDSSARTLRGSNIALNKEVNDDILSPLRKKSCNIEEVQSLKSRSSINDSVENILTIQNISKTTEKGSPKTKKNKSLLVSSNKEEKSNHQSVIIKDTNKTLPKENPVESKIKEKNKSQFGQKEKNDKITFNIECKSSNESINIEDNALPSNSNNVLPNKSAKNGKKDKLHNNVSHEEVKSPRLRNKLVESSVLYKNMGSKQLSNDRTSNVIQNNKNTGKYGVYTSYLKPLTRKVNFCQVDGITDISLCDIEEVDVPEKFDITCKVLSEFTLIEDGIQVVRIQDGTISKCSTLKIPQKSSWSEIVEDILKNPTVQEKSPYIDLIIFDYFRLEHKIVAGHFYKLNNIMAIRFQLKNDPRKEKKHTLELFFCTEGQHTNIKKYLGKAKNEINERLEEERYKKAWLEAVGTNEILEECPAANSITNSHDASIINSNKHNLTANLGSSLEVIFVREDSPANRKRKISEPVDEVCPAKKDSPANRKRKISEPVDEVCPAKEKKTITDKLLTTSQSRDSDKEEEKFNKTDGNDQFKINITGSSDETVLEETPPMMREISEILHEESLLGLPQTLSEDIHLKNSGSEITFSQFCKGAILKGQNFRTSTQNEESLEPKKIIDETEGKFENDTKIEDTTKMEPLVYCPSGSSASSAVDASPAKLEKSNDCPSIIEMPPNKLKTISEINISSLDHNKIDADNSSVRSDSSSIKVVSSNGSVEIDMEVFVCKDSKTKNVPGDQSNGRKCLKETADVIDKTPEILESESKDLATSNLPQSLRPDSKYNLYSERRSQNGHVSSKEGKNDNIEIVSNSSSASLFNVENNNTTVKPASYNSVINESIMFSDHNFEQMVMKIPDRCFYKSTAKPPPLTEDELNAVYDDENSPVKLLSYCHVRHLPVLTLDVIYSIKNTSSLTMTVTFISTTPSFDENWRENCFKSRCPSCNKLYDVYNALNNKYTDNTSSAAILVGGHVVCPESQCCNQILESPVFHFTVEVKLKDGTPLTAILTSNHAEDVFGCTAKDALRNETDLNCVGKTLEKITRNIEQQRLTKIVVTREEICHPRSGPIYIKKIIF